MTSLFRYLDKTVVKGRTLPVAMWMSGGFHGRPAVGHRGVA
ncbi:MAG: hypothetical protein R3F31_25425 [Verrucomicrobiales bacterium]